MSSQYQKPLPAISQTTRPYWEAAKRHQLVMQRCQECGHYRHPPGETCPHCLCDRLIWERVSGRGTVYSWAVFHQVYHPAFADDAPYAVVVVELEEAVRLTTSLIDCSIENITIGMAVEVVFDDVSEEISLPRFRPRLGLSDSAGR